MPRDWTRPIFRKPKRRLSWVVWATLSVASGYLAAVIGLELVS